MIIPEREELTEKELKMLKCSRAGWKSIKQSETTIQQGDPRLYLLQCQTYWSKNEGGEPSTLVIRSLRAIDDLPARNIDPKAVLSMEEVMAIESDKRTNTVSGIVTAYRGHLSPEEIIEYERTLTVRHSDD